MGVVLVLVIVLVIAGRGVEADGRTKPISTSVERPDYILDLRGDGGDEGEGDHPDRPTNPAAGGRRWLSIVWRCCGTYGRIYREPGATCYAGRCPSCGKSLTIPVGEGGTDSRFFEAW